MIDGSFSLFGLDLLGPSRRARREADQKSIDRKDPELARKRGDAGHHAQGEHSIALLWGMYPVY